VTIGRAWDVATWLRWVWANTWSELVGLGGSFALALLVLGPGGPATPAGVMGAAVAMIMVATLLEGVVVGVAQWRVLRRSLAGLTWRRWTGATALGALVAWTVGMVPATLMSLAEGSGEATPPEPGAAVVIALAFAMGLVLGPILAFFQWRVLRRHLPRAVWWIPANSAAWAFGMAVIFAAAGMLPEGASVLAMVGVLALTCLIAGAVVGAIHGVVLVWLLERAGAPPHTERPSR
jgi:hypothetical protein